MSSGGAAALSVCVIGALPWIRRRSGRGGNGTPAEQDRESRSAARADRRPSTRHPRFPDRIARLWTVPETVKWAFRYRLYPTPGQAAELARTFGCVRPVYHMALAVRTEATDEFAFLTEVSSVPLQQALRQFRTMLADKADWYGRDLAVVDRWFPSTRLRSACGALGRLSVIACGGGVRPQREFSSRTGGRRRNRKPRGRPRGFPSFRAGRNSTLPGFGGLTVAVAGSAGVPVMATFFGRWWARNESKPATAKRGLQCVPLWSMCWRRTVHRTELSGGMPRTVPWH
ncbi:helix-turn-helix domain-containing protein [Micromonospora sp. LOL_013]|uniref:helix-turn-helix domain-containing protein n=1 Tax=unclassified Micromonospora TaxID=2617518 RepID=UPI003A8624AF